jgi:hypothetical protein
VSARSDRRVMVATTSFAIDGELGEQLVGKHPAVVQTGVSSGAIKQGTHLWSDDRIVQAYPSLFVDASIVPTAGQSAHDAAAPDDRPSRGGAPSGTGLTWDDVVAKTAELWQTGDQPTAEAVAGELGCTDRYVRTLTKPHGGWSAVLDAVRAMR